MKKLAYVALGTAIGCAAVSLFVHRRVIAAVVKGDPIPEPPEWHKKWHPCFNKEA